MSLSDITDPVTGHRSLSSSAVRRTPLSVDAAFCRHFISLGLTNSTDGQELSRCELSVRRPEFGAVIASTPGGGIYLRQALSVPAEHRDALGRLDWTISQSASAHDRPARLALRASVLLLQAQPSSRLMPRQTV